MNKIGFVFPGQGSQYVGMGKKIFDQYDVARKTFEEASDILCMDIKKMCFNSKIEELTETSNAQPAILTVSVASFRVISQEYGLEPTLLAGHSLGEFSALACAGALTFSDALKLVRKRGIIMQEASLAGGGSMAAVNGLDAEMIEAVCGKYSEEGKEVVISNYNSRKQTVISGADQSVKKAVNELEELGGQVIALKVSGAFHSPLMKPAAAIFKNELMKCACNEPKWPVVANVTAQIHTVDDIIDLLTRQMTEPVKWVKTIEFLEKSGIDTVIELGPKAVLKKLVGDISVSMTACAFDNEEDYKTICHSAKEREKKGFRHTVITKCIAVALCTPNLNFDREEYQRGVVEPLKQMKNMQLMLKNEGLKPTKEQMTEAIRLLNIIMATKKVSQAEKKERFVEILEETDAQGIFKDFEISEVV